MEKKTSLEKLFKTEIYSTIIPVLAGAYSGYCNAQGISLENEFLERAIREVPIIIEAGLGALLGPAYVKDVYHPNFLNEEEVRTSELIIGGGISILGTIAGAIKGTVGVGLGYGVGFLIGHVAK